MSLTHCLALSMASLSTLSMAQTDLSTAVAQAPIEDVDRLERRTLDLVVAGSPDVATRVFADNPLMSGRTVELSALNSQIASTIAIYGRALRWERAGERRVSEFLSVRRYIVQHENMLTVWYISYAKIGSGWVVANLQFSDQISNLDPDW